MDMDKVGLERREVEKKIEDGTEAHSRPGIN